MAQFLAVRPRRARELFRGRAVFGFLMCGSAADFWQPAFRFRQFFGEPSVEIFRRSFSVFDFGSVADIFWQRDSSFAGSPARASAALFPLPRDLAAGFFEI